MRTLMTTLLFAFLFPFAALAQVGLPDADRSLEGVILVKFAPDAVKTPPQQLRLSELQGPEAAQTRQLLRPPLIQGEQGRGQKIFRTFAPRDTLTQHRQTGEPVRLIDLSRWYRFAVHDTTDVDALAQRLEALPSVLQASPDYEARPDYTPEEAVADHPSASHRTDEQPHAVRTVPNDPKFDEQWAYDNPATDADVDAPEAWSINTGRSDVTVAVVDGGVDLDHPDLDPGDRSRVVQGYDFGDNDNNPDDDAITGIDRWGDHGTPVAGTIGARTDNSEGVAGLMWDLQIMPLKIAETSTGIASASSVIEAFDYARSNGADIINFSGSFPSSFGALEETVWNAYAAGLIMVASSSNDSEDSVRYPAALTSVIGVGATDDEDFRCTVGRCGFGSNYGPRLDLVAPNGFETTSRGVNGDLYDGFGGTSQAAPVVSGVAGLILSESRDQGLGLTNAAVQRLMEQTADNVEDMDDQDFTEEYGHGRVNARKALEALQPPNEVVQELATGGSSNRVREDFQQVFYASPSPGGLASGTYFVDVYEVTGQASFSTYFQDEPPLVWIREEDTKGWSAANPNTQQPYVKISNVTQEGFDYKTWVYYVKSNTSGQQINEWYPASPSGVDVAYNAMGEPGTFPLEVTLSGPGTVDSGQEGTWTANVEGGEGSTSYRWAMRAPGSTNWTLKFCSGPSCSHTFSNFDDQIQDGAVRVSVTRGSETVQASQTVFVSPDCADNVFLCPATQLAEVSSFAAEPQGEAAHLAWTTTGSMGEGTFRVQHRADSTAAWSDLQTVEVAERTQVDSTDAPMYQLETDALAPGTHQFRLQWAAGGETALLSDVVEAEIALEDPYRLRAYPNPAGAQMTVEGAVKERQHVRVQIYDVLGRRVTTVYDGPMAPNEVKRFTVQPGADGLSSGTYFLRMTGEQFQTTTRISVVR